MHDSDALRSLFSTVCILCVFGLKHYLTLKEGFGERLHLLCPSLSREHPVSPTGIEFLLILRYMNFFKQVPGFPLPLEEKASLGSFLSLSLQRDFALTFQSRSRLITCKLAPRGLFLSLLGTTPATWETAT